MAVAHAPREPRSIYRIVTGPAVLSYALSVEQLRNAFERMRSESMYLSSAEQKIKTESKIDALMSVQPDWDGYGAKPPGSRSIAAARRFLDQIGPFAPEPTVVPSAEGGVGIYFFGSRLTCFIECLDEEEGATLAIYGDHREPEVIQIPDDGGKPLLSGLRRFWTAELNG